jgi:ribose transport system permease protein
VKCGLLGGCAIARLTFSALQPHVCLKIANLRSKLRLAAPGLVVAAGLTVVLVRHDFDISIGSAIGLAGALAVVLQANAHMDAVFAIAGAIATGALAGVVNEFLVGYLGGNALMITLAMMTAVCKTPTCTSEPWGRPR